MSKTEVEKMTLDPIERTLAQTRELPRTLAEDILMAICNNGMKPKYPVKEQEPCQRQ